MKAEDSEGMEATLGEASRVSEPAAVAPNGRATLLYAELG